MSEIIASQSGHWYAKDGTPVYEVPRAKGDGIRPTTLADARKLDLLPSVTLILGCAAKPGLDVWKLRQMFEVAYTTPRLDGESDDDFYGRVVLESKEKARLSAEKGTGLHAAIENYIWGITNPTWDKHCEKIIDALNQYGIDLFKGKPEHSFASPLGYGGKIDWHNDEIVLDFKTKKDLSAKRLAYDENCWQLAAYAVGVYGRYTHQRAINVFIGIDDCEVRIHEWSPEDAKRGWNAFECLLKFWQIKNQFGSMP